MKNFIIVLVLSSLFLLAFASCGAGTSTDTGSNDTSAVDVTSADVTTAVVTSAEVTTAEVTTAEATTAEVTSAAPTDGNYELNPSWHLGYPGSSTHSSYANKLNTSGGAYSYSQIIKFPTAGTVITFTDDNTNSNGDTNYASASAYVISSWKQTSGGEWELDLGGYNASGTAVSYSDQNGARTYQYKTTKDNEYLRFCFRSGQSSSFTPAAFPTINAKGGAQPEIISETQSNPGEKTLEGTATVVNWISGYVGSDTNPYGYDYKLNPGAGGYAYTEVIEVAKAGTMLSFLDPNGGATSNNAFVVSSWEKSGSDWVINKDGTNLAGSPDQVVSTTSYGKLYVYITSKDNECIRFCYRSDGQETLNPVKIYIKENAGKGTVQMMNEAQEDLANFLKNDLTRADYSAYFKNKTMYVIGDSYFAGNGLNQDYVWPSLLAQKYGMDFANYGMNGSAISAYASSNNPMVNRYSSMKSGSPDIVIIEGGKNDYNQNVPLGTVDSTDKNTFYGSLRALINGIQAKYPTAKIICLTPWHVDGTNNLGLTVQSYGTAMKNLCVNMGVACIDAQNQSACGVYMTDSSFRSQYCMTASDISHLNLSGMKLVLPFFEKQIYDICTAG